MVLIFYIGFGDWWSDLITQPLGWTLLMNTKLNPSPTNQTSSHALMPIENTQETETSTQHVGCESSSKDQIISNVSTGIQRT